MTQPSALDRFLCPGDDAHAPPPEPRLWLLALALGPLSALVRGYAPGLYNGVVHVASLRQRIDPSLYPDDLLMMSHNAYPSLLWDAVAFVAPATGLWTAMFWFFILQQILLHYAVLRLAWHLGGSPMALLATSLHALLVVAPGFGGSQWTTVNLMHTTTAFPILIVALVDAMCGRWWRASLWWIVGLLVHPPNAAFVTGPLILATLGHLAAHPPARRQWPAMLGAAAMAAFALALQAWRILAVPAGAAPTLDELRTLIPAPVALHVFVAEHFATPESIRRLATFGLQAIVAIWIVAAARLDRRILLPWVGAILGGALLIAASILTTELIESASLARLQRLRTADFLHFLFLMSPLALSARWAIGATRLHPIGVAPFLALAFLGSQMWTGEPEWWIAALLVVALSHAAAASRLPWPAAWRLGLAERPFIAMLLLAIAWPAAVVAINGEILEQSWRRQEHKASAFAREWRDAQEASNRKLPPHQTILTPPYDRGWRVHSRHSPFLELSDNIGGILKPSIFAEYQRRARALGHTQVGMRQWIAETGALYESGTAADFERLMRSEALRYAVVYHPIDIDGARTLWRGLFLKLIDIGPPPGHDAPTPSGPSAS